MFLNRLIQVTFARKVQAIIKHLLVTMVHTAITLVTQPRVIVNSVIRDLCVTVGGSRNPMESVLLGISVEVAPRQINLMMLELRGLHALLVITVPKEQVRFLELNNI